LTLKLLICESSNAVLMRQAHAMGRFNVEACSPIEEFVSGEVADIVFKTEGSAKEES
jgi:hypothetical protein